MPPEPDGLFFVSIILTLLSLILASQYAACESAANGLSLSKLEREAEDGSKKAKTLIKVLDAQKSLVSPFQCGLLFFSLFGLAVALSAFREMLQSCFGSIKHTGLRSLIACLLIALIYTLVFLLFADLLPKKLAHHKAESYARRHSRLMWTLVCLARPLLFVCGGAANIVLRLFRIDPDSLNAADTEEEILEMLGEGEKKGVIEETERDMITNIFDFNDTTVSETMTHRTDIVAVADDASIEELLSSAVDHGFSRVPVYHEDVDNIVGICYIKDLLPYVGKEMPDFIKLTDLMRQAYFIPETKKCSQLFSEMTERKVQIAIVVDEYGGTAGLISLEDLVESIFGSIQDEYDHEEEEIQKVSETEFTVDGTTSIDEISDLTGVELPEGDYDTIAGLVTEQLGRIPKEDEHPTVQVNRLSITVLKVEDQRLSRLFIVKEPPRTDDEEEEKEE